MIFKLNRLVAILWPLSIIGVAFLKCALGAPIGLGNLHSLSLQADVIVVGTVTQGQQSGRTVSLVLGVDRVLKGDVSPSQTLTVQWLAPDSPKNSRDLKGSKGMYFLKKQQSNIWLLIPVFSGDAIFDLAILPATTKPTSPDLQYGSLVSIDEKILFELAAAVENEKGSGFGVDYLASFDLERTPAISPAFQRLAKSTEPRLKAYGISGLLRQGDAEVLSKVITELPTMPPNAFRESVINNVCQYSNSSLTAVRALGLLSKASITIPGLKVCAAYALRRIHTKDTLEYLHLLLDDQDPAVRYEGVAGMASFANSGFIPQEAALVIDGIATARMRNRFKTSDTLQNFPTIDSFKKNEAKFINFWKTWWSAVQAEL